MTGYEVAILLGLFVNLVLLWLVSRQSDQIKEYERLMRESLALIEDQNDNIEDLNRIIRMYQRVGSGSLNANPQPRVQPWRWTQ